MSTLLMGNAEARAELLARVGRKSEIIPPEHLVDLVMRCVPPEEWPTRVAALDALLRRLESAHREELRVATRPPQGRALGTYATRRRAATSRPYETLLRGVDPIDARCSCPDFAKNSLGICKHVVAVLELLHSKPKLLSRAHGEQAQEAENPRAGLAWDPVRPLTGLGDWLERVVWRGGFSGRASVGERRARALARFKNTDRGTDERVLGRTYLDQPGRRLELVDDLVFLSTSAGMRDANLLEAVDPTLRGLLLAERDRLRRIIAGKLDPAGTRSALKTLKRKLYPYQRVGLERFLATGRLLLADDMGLGKTAQAIACAHVLLTTGRARRVLIITPASLKPQWAREWLSFTDIPARIVEGSPLERQAAYAGRPDGVFLINYEQLIRDLDTVRGWEPDLVVLDEAQRIKNWATKTALSVKGLNSPYRLVLTGTPMENRVEELASVVEWVDDQAMEPKWRLSAFHALRADGRRETVGVRHLDTLRERLRPCMLRRIRREVLDQLPPRTDTRVPIEMTEAQVEEHDALNRPIASILARAAKRPLTREEFLRLMQLLLTQRVISNGLAQAHFEQFWPGLKGRAADDGILASLSAPKLLELRQLARQVVLDQGRKVVIFSQWRRMLTLAHWALADLLATDGLRGGFFTGAEKTSRRTQNIVEFHDDPRFRILFATDAGGVGLNLQRAANCVINLELPWNPAVLEQRIGRVYRLGQEQPIDVYNLVCEYGIESRIAGLVGSKQAFFSGLFDGESDTVCFDEASSFLARVSAIYAQEMAQAAGGGGAEAEGTAEPEDAGALAEAEEDLDEGVADPFEPLVEAADEAADSAPVAAAETSTRTREAAPVAAPASVPAAAPAMAAGRVRELFGQLEARKSSDGRVIIEAPPEVAESLGALLEGMAALLRSLSGPPGDG